MKKLILIIIFLLPISISSFVVKNKTTFFKPTIIVHLTDRDLYLDLEDYIFGVVSGEMPALFKEEALKAQAVASRSYALSKNSKIIEITSTISDQVYYPNYELKDHWQDKYEEYSAKINNAISSTKGEVLKRDNNILKTYYFSMSNGYTENSETVFNESLFNSVESNYEKALPNFEVTKTYSLKDIYKLLNITSLTIGEINRSETNHVTTIKINDQEYSGIELRKLLNLRSTDFEIKVNESNIEVTTKGYGHGVGMSQYGANEMAKQGIKYKEILNHYYKNSKLTKI